jgi:hypothetical protein
MVKYCKSCGCELETGTKWCSSCKKKRKREYAKNRYKKLKAEGKIIRYGIGICIYCGKEFIKSRPDQLGHGECRLNNFHRTTEDYNKVKRSGIHTVGRKTILDLGFKLTNNMCIHHLDENPDNNQLSNLLILNRSNHSQLHRLLERNWSLLLKDNSNNLENCWNTLRDQLTTAYLEMKGANVIKITDIGQSAVEPLNEENIYMFNLQEEGSETMHQVPKDNID